MKARRIFMKKYEYVPIKTGKFFGSKCTEHRRIIDEYAKNGYRYAGFIPTEITDSGKFREIELIFEKDE